MCLIYSIDLRLTRNFKIASGDGAGFPLEGQGRRVFRKGLGVDPATLKP